MGVQISISWGLDPRLSCTEVVDSYDVVEALVFASGLKAEPFHLDDHPGKWLMFQFSPLSGSGATIHAVAGLRQLGM